MIRGRLESAFAGRNALITGGAGFIGSNLAIALSKLGASVTVADAMIPGYGGNLFNLDPILDRVIVNYCDIRDPNAMNWLVRNQDYVFHLAGQVDHILSLSDPFPDIDMNIKGTAVVIEACRIHNPEVKVIYTGTRGQYGPATTLPVNEDAPTHPKGIYEISNLTAEKIIKVYSDVHGVRSVLLRLTNVYGPRAQMRHARYGVANWFIRQALDNEVIHVFGDGSILRDFLYVDDCVDAILMSASHPETVGEVLNVGCDQPTNFRQLADLVIAACCSGHWEFAEFTPERRAQEPGDFYSDISKIRHVVGWEPVTPLAAGLRATAEYYRRHRERYW